MARFNRVVSKGLTPSLGSSGNAPTTFFTSAPLWTAAALFVAAFSPLVGLAASSTWTTGSVRLALHSKNLMPETENALAAELFNPVFSNHTSFDDNNTDLHQMEKAAADYTVVTDANVDQALVRFHDVEWIPLYLDWLLSTPYESTRHILVSPTFLNEIRWPPALQEQVVWALRDTIFKVALDYKRQINPEDRWVIINFLFEVLVQSGGAHPKLESALKHMLTTPNLPLLLRTKTEQLLKQSHARGQPSCATLLQQLLSSSTL